MKIVIMERYNMRQVIYSRLGTPRTLMGTWRIEGECVTFSPFLQLDTQVIQSGPEWRDRAGYDLHRDFQILAYADRSLYFEREHSILLTSTSVARGVLRNNLAPLLGDNNDSICIVFSSNELRNTSPLRVFSGYHCV